MTLTTPEAQTNLYIPPSPIESSPAVASGIESNDVHTITPRLLDSGVEVDQSAAEFLGVYFKIRTVLRAEDLLPPIDTNDPAHASLRTHLAETEQLSLAAAYALGLGLEGYALALGTLWHDVGKVSEKFSNLLALPRMLSPIEQLQLNGHALESALLIQQHASKVIDSMAGSNQEGNAELKRITDYAEWLARHHHDTIPDNLPPMDELLLTVLKLVDSAHATQDRSRPYLEQRLRKEGYLDEGQSLDTLSPEDWQSVHANIVIDGLRRAVPHRQLGNTLQLPSKDTKAVVIALSHYVLDGIRADTPK